jgi:hypothetical protein
MAHKKKQHSKMKMAEKKNEMHEMKESKNLEWRNTKILSRLNAASNVRSGAR